MDSSRPLVLLAEDDNELRQLISLHLTRLGMRVVEVPDGLQLHDYLCVCCSDGKLPTPDIVISDVDMPGESGPAAIERAQYAKSPVVLITAAPARVFQSSTSKFAAVEVITKPFALKELVQTIRRVIAMPRPDPVS